jgi:2-oxoglutarate dehydrogenase E1 component
VINPNEAFIEDLYFDFLKDPNSVSPAWREYFSEIDGKSISVMEAPKPDPNYSTPTQNYGSSNNPTSSFTSDNYTEKAGENLEFLSNVASKIAQNMQESLQVPTATSIRTIPVKALDENRKIINKFLIKQRRPKVSFSQILLWAIVKALEKFPNLNNAFTFKDGKPTKIVRNEINLGVAIDLVKKNGTRLLLVPNIKNAGQYHFSEFINKVNDLINRARNNKLQVDELQGTSVSLTNPGMIGTSASVPRLMKEQGLIIASGSIDYPVEFQAVRPEVMTTLALSKVVTMTSTYDHRIIQGAESAEFLAYLNKLLLGEGRFYDQIFASLKIPFEPVRWSIDVSVRKYGIDNTRTRVEKGAHVMQMLNAYRVRGHLLASINPLGLDSYYYPELEPSYYGLTIWDLDREFPASSTWKETSYPLREIIDRIRDVYCGSIGIEYMHIQDIQKKDFVKKWFEVETGKPENKPEDKISILKKLIEAEQFESFLHKKFIGSKRFSLEGSESMIVMLDKMFDEAADSDAHTVIVGMAHRGRLNVLVNNIGKNLEQIFNEFDGDIDTNYYHGAGDVKYHLGQTGQHISSKNKAVHVRLTPNPSHLEIVDPVVLGIARAEIDNDNNAFKEHVLPVVIHGDSAFAGQGVVQETLNLANLTGYSTGGTIHIVINNQIGFTTTAESARSTTYATDAAKMASCPILHVNGNDPEAVVEAAKFAFDYRQKYQSDVIIDLLSFRKYGHNEGDEPSYTQPLLYKKIRKMKPVREIYQQRLIDDGILNDQSAKGLLDEFLSKLNIAYDNRKVSKPDPTRIPESKVGQTFQNYATNITDNQVQVIKSAITQHPENFNANPKVKGGLKQREKMIEAPTPKIDWATCEALAFGGMLLDGTRIRLSGEDSGRGTFSQRHAVLTDFSNENTYVPLNNISADQQQIQIFDSPLSELAVLGFDYGYSVAAEDSLTLWEAQFGDFANMAQPIVDQFISCGEVKWKQRSNLVMLLPHGHDGQGPEHSSARVERFLQLCADENMIVANFTSPANYFHALRRQVKFKYKTPLIIMTPKSMLRHIGAVSSVNDLVNGQFMHLIDDDQVDKSGVKRIVLCSGKIYYDLLAERDKNQKNDVAIVRLEQIYPLHLEMLKSIVAGYSNAEEIVWCQEEPKNQGVWTFVCNDLYETFRDKKVIYSGRIASASTATGSAKIHDTEQKRVIDDTINGKF